MSYHSGLPSPHLSGYTSTTRPGQIVDSPVNDDPGMISELRPTDPIEAAALVQRQIANVALEVTDADAAVGRATQRASVPSSYQNTRLWLRQKLDELRDYVASTPAVAALNEVQARSAQISESAGALRALAERIA